MSDETEDQLAAFLDGTLDPAEADRFAARLEAEPELAARAERWMANDRRIAAAFAPIAEEPIGPDLLAAMGLAKTPAPAAANDNPPWWRRYGLPLGGALAAGIVAALVLAPQGRAPQHDLSFALETGRALVPVRLADGRTVTPTLTVKAADGRWCREYREDAAVGLACRTDGGWKVEATGRGDGPARGDAIAVASGADGSALDGAYRRIGASDPLDGKAEADLIAKGWPAR